MHGTETARSDLQQASQRLIVHAGGDRELPGGAGREQRSLWRSGVREVQRDRATALKFVGLVVTERSIDHAMRQAQGGVLWVSATLPPPALTAADR